MNKELRNLQLEEKKILDVFVSICEKNNFRYYLTGGTLLGAVRHQGFIPWDDDIDIVMPRPDYEAFIKQADSEIQEPFYIKHIHNDKQCRFNRILIASKNYHIVSHVTNNEQTMDAWIDIFSMDGMPKNIIKRTIHKILLTYYEGMSKIAQYDDVVNTARERGFINGLLVKVAGLPLFRLNKDYRKYLLKLDTQLKKYEYDTCDTVCDFIGGYGFKETFKREDNGVGCYLEFEGSQYKCPIHYKTVLTIIYGADYMIPPPENERNKHCSDLLQ